MKTLLASLALLVAMAVSAQAQDSDLESIDENSDGKVTVAEFKEYAENRLPPDFELLDEFAKKVDADGNGEISEDEFSKRMNALQSMPLKAAPGDDENEKKDKSSDKKKKTDKSAAEAYKKLSKHVEKSDWKNAAKLMTQNAQDEFAATQFMTSKSFLSVDMPIPGMDDVLDNVKDVFDKYDLDDLDVDIESMFKVEMMDGDFDDEKEDKDKKDKDDKKESKKGDSKSSPAEKQKELQKTILKLMDKDNKRWEIVSDLWKAQEGSPFQMSHLNGTIKKLEVEKDYAFIKVEMKLPQQDDMPNSGFLAPPIWVKMKKVKDNWNFDGVAEKRTQKAMQEWEPDIRQFRWPLSRYCRWLAQACTLSFQNPSQTSQ